MLDRFWKWCEADYRRYRLAKFEAALNDCGITMGEYKHLQKRKAGERGIDYEDIKPLLAIVRHEANWGGVAKKVINDFYGKYPEIKP